jgi:hypothetical protein
VLALQGPISLGYRKDATTNKIEKKNSFGDAQIHPLTIKAYLCQRGRVLSVALYDSTPRLVSQFRESIVPIIQPIVPPFAAALYARAGIWVVRV